MDDPKTTPTPPDKTTPAEASPKEAPAKPKKPSKPISPKTLKIAVAVLGALLLATTGVSAYLLLNDSDSVKVSSGVSDAADDEDETDAEEADEDLGAEEISEEDECECEECLSCTEHPSYTLDIGDSGGITVPEGWYVSKFVSDYELSPDELIAVLPVPQNGGWYPIHESTLIELTNDTSVITMSSSETMMLGAFGAELGPMESGYTVFLEPGIGDPDRGGGARKLDGTEYIYELVFTCGDPVMCGDYGVMNGEIPYDRFTFEGAAGDLSTADDLFEEAFVDGGFDAKES